MVSWPVRRQALLHLGLAPQNVVITQDSVRLLHYGERNIALNLHSDHSFLNNASRSDFAAPEVRNDDHVDERSDIYSAAAVITVLFAGLGLENMSEARIRRPAEKAPHHLASLERGALDLLLARALSFSSLSVSLMSLCGHFSLSEFVFLFPCFCLFLPLLFSPLFFLLSSLFSFSSLLFSFFPFFFLLHILLPISPVLFLPFFIFRV